MALQVRRGTNAERLGITPAEGELIYTTDTKQLYVGDGTTAGGTASIASTIDSLLADSTPQLGGNLDLNNFNINGTGNIDITGTITASGTVNLGDGVGSDILVIGGAIQGHLVPDVDSTHNLGAPAKYWNEMWLRQLNVDSQITAERIQADIIADDSTVVFNAATGQIAAAQVTGTFSGAVTGDVTGNIASAGSSSFSGIVDLNGATVNNASFNLTGDIIGASTGAHNGTVGATTPAAGSFTTVNASSTITGNLVGNVTGYVTGDVTGSLFGNDSTALVDGNSNAVTARTITTTDIGPANGTDLKFNAITTNFNRAQGVSSRIFMHSTTATSFGTGLLNLVNTHTNVYSDDLAFSRARGTPDSLATIQANDKLGGLAFNGYDGSGYQFAADIQGYADAISAGNITSNVCIRTRQGAISTLAIGLKVEGDQTVKLNTLDVLTGDVLTINKAIKLPISTAEPATPANGQIAIADGTTWNPASNAKQSLVAYLGGAWVLVAAAA